MTEHRRSSIPYPWNVGECENVYLYAVLVPLRNPPIDSDWSVFCMMLSSLALNLLLSGYAFAAPTSVDDSSAKVPLSRTHLTVRNDDGTVNPAWYFSELDHTLIKYGLFVDWPFAKDAVSSRSKLGKRGEK
jgi:hypothetical protein